MPDIFDLLGGGGQVITIPPAPRAPYPTGLPSIAFANGTYTATDAPFGGDGTITVTRRWLLDGVSVGTGATLADSSTIQAGKVLVLENDATSSTTGAAAVKPVSLPFAIPKANVPSINITKKPVLKRVADTVVLDQAGEYAAFNMPGVNIGTDTALLQAGEKDLTKALADGDDFPLLTIEYSNDGQALEFYYRAFGSLNGVEISASVRSDSLLISQPDERAPFIIQGADFTAASGRTVGSDVERVAATFGPEAHEKTFSWRWVDVAYADPLTNEYLNGVAQGALRASDVLLSSSPQAVFKIPASMETPPEDRGLQRVTRCQTDFGVTWSVTPILGPVVLSSSSPLTITTSTVAESLVAGAVVTAINGKTAGSTVTLSGGGDRFALNANQDGIVGGLVPLDYATTAELSSGVRGYRLTLTETVGANLPTTSIVEIAVTEVVKFVKANSISQGDITFGWQGVARRIERNFDGSCTVIVPDGVSITFDAPTPIATGSGTALRGGVMINPIRHLRGSTVASTYLAFDGRTPNFFADNLAAFPRALGAGDIIVKTMPAPEGTTKRRGYAAQAAVLYIINETQAAAMSGPFSEMIPPPAFGWAGRTNIQKVWRRANLAAVMALRKKLSTAGLTRPTNQAAIVTRLARFNPTLMATTSNGDTGGYEDVGLYAYGNAEGNTGYWNYGANIAESFGTAAEAFIAGDLADVQLEPTIKAWIALGSQHVDLNEGQGVTEVVDGGHFQFWSYLDVVGLIGTSRKARIPDLATISPQNQLTQSIKLTSAQVALCAAHDDPTRPYYARRRTVTFSGLEITQTQRTRTGDPYHQNYGGMNIRLGSTDAIVGLSGQTSDMNRTATAALPNGLWTYPISAVTGLTQNAEVYASPLTAVAVDQCHFILEGVTKFAGFNPGPKAPYRAIQSWTPFLMWLRGLDAYDAATYSIMEAVVIDANDGSRGNPDMYGYYGTTQGSFIGWNAYTKEFWAKHKAALGVGGAAQPIPVNSAAPTVTGSFQADGTSSVSTGTWSNDPTSFLYQWYTGTPGSGSAITNATGQTHTWTSAQIAAGSGYGMVAARNSGGTSAYVASSAITPPIVVTPPSGNKRAGLVMGQSELDVLFKVLWAQSGQHGSITLPTIPAAYEGKFILYSATGSGNPGDNVAEAVSEVTAVPLTNANKSSFSPAILYLALLCYRLAPTLEIHFGEATEQGTSWLDFASDYGVSGISEPDTLTAGRKFSDTKKVVTKMVEAVGTVHRFATYWYAADWGVFNEVYEWMMPIAFRQRTANGVKGAAIQAMPLGTQLTPETYRKNVVNHTLYNRNVVAGTAPDADALFSTDTAWDWTTKASWNDAADYQKKRNEAIYKVLNDQRFIDLGGKVGPNGGYWSQSVDGKHPDKDRPLGVVQAAYRLLAPLAMRLCDVSADESHLGSCYTAADGSYTELIHTPKRGGVLRTQAELMGLPNTPALAADNVAGHQPVWGFEVERTIDGVKEVSPIWRTDFAGAVDWKKLRGTVTRQSDTRIRITWEIPIAADEPEPKIFLQRWSTSDPSASPAKVGYYSRKWSTLLGAAEKAPSDSLVPSWLYLPIEHVASQMDSALQLPFHGIPVRTMHDEWVCRRGQTTRVSMDDKGTTRRSDAGETIAAGGGGDTADPVLTNPTDAALSATSGVGGITVNEPCTLYAAVTAGLASAAPTPAQVKAGTGGGILGAASKVLSSAGATTINVTTGQVASSPYRMHFAAEDTSGNLTDVAVSGDGYTTSAAPAVSPFVTASGASLADPNNLGAGVTALRFKARLRVPTAAALTASNGRTLYWQGGGGLQVYLQRNAAGSSTIYLVNASGLEDGNGNVLAITGSSSQALADNTWGVHEFKVDMVAGTVTSSLDGGNAKTGTFTPPSAAYFQSGQKLVLLSNAASGGSGAMPTGYEFEYIEVYKTVGGVETLYKRVEGPAATANADGWKNGTASFT